MNRLSIAQNMTPSQKGPYRSMIEPGEILGGADWRFSLSRDPRPWLIDDRVQSDNYFDMNERYKQISNGMFNPLTGGEPVYGHVDYTRTRDGVDNVNNMAANNLYKQTRVAWNNGLSTLNMPPSRYPQSKDYYNFQGSLGARLSLA